MCSQATVVSPLMAETYLARGSKSYSKIGKYCPVTMKSTKRLKVEDFGTKPVVFGQHVYFVKNDANVAEFCFRPRYYCSNLKPSPMLFTTVCIVGDTKSGKTTLAASLAKSLDAVHLTIPKILQGIIDGQEITLLCDELKAFLKAGNAVPDNLVIEAVILMTSRIITSGKGYI